VRAVDGGNSKTDLALLDEDGTVLSAVRGPGSSPHELGSEGCVELLGTLAAQAIAGLGVLDRPFAATAQVMLAGADLPEERADLRERIERLRWSERLVVDNDTPALLRAGTDRGWGIAVVCGAGINCLGRRPDGREVRFLSLGQISGDWGGGLDVGLAALAAAARSADGRGPRTPLESAVPAHFGLGGPFEVARALHLRELPMARLAELAPIVLAACEADAVSAGIVRRVSDEVIAFARAALSRLELTGADPDVILGGGILRAVPDAEVETIAREVHELAPDARVLVAASEPIVGAALLALDALATNASAEDRARADLDAIALTRATQEPGAPSVIQGSHLARRWHAPRNAGMVNAPPQGLLPS
jgi:N-acetylglucosamine kinase-like BadF-type ATPase